MSLIITFQRGDMVMQEEEQEQTGDMGKKQSNREAVRAELLKEALGRPGVREAMEVYRDWQRADSGLDSYRAATKQPWITTTTDHANVR